jgi:hypothetical protein
MAREIAIAEMAAMSVVASSNFQDLPRIEAAFARSTA